MPRFPKLRLTRPKWLPRLPRALRIGLLAAAATAGAVGLAFAADRATNGGEILGTVVVEGVDIGGLNASDAAETLRLYEDSLRDLPVVVEVAGRTFELDPKAIVFDLDEDAAVAEAMRNGRDGTVLAQFGWWVRNFVAGNETLEAGFSYDEALLAEIMRQWEIEGIDEPAYAGDVRVEDGAIVVEYPAQGTGIDTDQAIPLIAAALQDPNRSPVTLPTRFLEPTTTAEQIDAVAAEAHAMVDERVRLTNGDLGTEVTFDPTLLIEALIITRTEDPDGGVGFSLSFDPAPLIAHIEAMGPALETEAVDAEMVIDDEAETVEIVPSIPVTAPDTDRLVDAILTAIDAEGRQGDLPYTVVREAEFSTADAEALGIKGVIGEFTTNHPCCAKRVINIQRIADAVDGALVMPGELFSVNDHVGKRTVDKGYVCAGALQGGELVEEGEICIGGGTSQFATTLYNAVFFAGLEDVSHTPHSAWFSRYPEGREATMGWRSPELIFRNNTENAVVIRTSHTDTSITVKIYGDNGGLLVEAGLSGRYNHTSMTTVKRQNPELAAPYCSEATAKVAQKGAGGWSVTVYRYITYPDGTKTTESWPHRYAGMWQILEWDETDPTCAPPDTTTTTTTVP